MTRQKQKTDFNLNEYDLRKLPHSSACEKKVLGTILFLPELFSEGLRYLNAKGMFYDELNQKVWETMVSVSNKGGLPSTSAVKIEFERQNNGELVAYTHVLETLSEPPLWFKSNCLKLNEFWIRRTMARMGHYVNQNALSETIDPIDLLSTSSSAIGNIFLHVAKMKEKTLQDSALELANDLVRLSEAKNGLLGLPSILSELNRVIKGYRKGNVIVLAASTGEGKTTFALNETQNLLEMDIPVGYVSLEMKTSELMLMMACRKTGVPSETVLGGHCTTEQFNAIADYVAKIKNMPLKISEQGGLKVSEIKALGRMWKEKYSIQILFIDHLHLVNADDPSLQSEAKFTVIANELKALAKELDIPIVELAQFARQDKSQPRPHKIEDLKYASGIEQAADVVIMIYRPEKHGIDKTPEGKSTAGYARFMIGKLRLLKAENIKAKFTGMEFKDWEEFPYYNSIPPSSKFPIQGRTIDFSMPTDKEDEDAPY